MLLISPRALSRGWTGKLIRPHFTMQS